MTCGSRCRSAPPRSAPRGQAYRLLTQLRPRRPRERAIRPVRVRIARSVRGATRAAPAAPGGGHLVAADLDVAHVAAGAPAAQDAQPSVDGAATVPGAVAADPRRGGVP